MITPAGRIVITPVGRILAGDKSPNATTSNPTQSCLYHVVGRVATRSYDVIYRKRDGKVFHKLLLGLQDQSSGGTSLLVELWGQNVADELAHQIRLGSVVLITNLARKEPDMQAITDELVRVRGDKHRLVVENERPFTQPFWHSPGTAPNLAKVFSCDHSVQPRIAYIGSEQAQAALAGLYDGLAQQDDKPHRVKKEASLQRALSLPKGSHFDVVLLVVVAAAEDAVYVTDCPRPDDDGSSDGTVTDVAVASPARLVFETREARRQFIDKHREFAAAATLCGAPAGTAGTGTGTGAGAYAPIAARCHCLCIHRTKRDCQFVTEVLYSRHSAVEFVPSDPNPDPNPNSAVPVRVDEVSFACLYECLRPACTGSASSAPSLRGHRVRTQCTLSGVQFAGDGAVGANAAPCDGAAPASMARRLVEVHRGIGAAADVDCWYRPALLTLASGDAMLRALVHDTVLQRIFCNVPAGVLLAAATYPALYSADHRPDSVPGMPGDLSFLSDMVARCVAGLRESCREHARVMCVVRAPEVDADNADDPDGPTGQGFDVVLLNIVFFS